MLKHTQLIHLFGMKLQIELVTVLESEYGVFKGQKGFKFL